MKADTIRIKVHHKEPYVARVLGKHHQASSTMSAKVAAERAAKKYFGDREFAMTEEPRTVDWQTPHLFVAVDLKQLHQALVGKAGGQ